MIAAVYSLLIFLQLTAAAIMYTFWFNYPQSAKSS